MIGILQMCYSWQVASCLGIGATTQFSRRELLTAMRSAWLPLLIPVIVIGGIIGGIFTATEAWSCRPST
jgi:TRAP-type C4-dicarboxylate transport system permease large subunit